MTPQAPQTPSRAAPPIRSRRALAWACCYWVLVALICGYVALATPHRSEVLTADAWEHHRAVRALDLHGWHPGNPTYATDEPSIRYSPYSAALALACTWIGTDPFNAMSVAAVVNTLLLLAGLWALLSRFRRQVIAVPALLSLLLLYGAAPGYANSFALADLPWHQVNPSACAAWLCVWAWVLWLWSARTSALCALAVSILLAAAMLTHAMTGFMGGLGLAAFVIVRPALRARGLIMLTAAACIAFALCCAWPLYPFLKAITTRPDGWYWFNPGTTKSMMLVWCLPATLASLAALPFRRDPLVRWAFTALGLVWACALLAIVTRSATLVRLPLAAMILAHMLVGFTAWRWGLLRPSGWGGVVRAWRRPMHAGFPRALLATLLLFALLYFGLPQCFAVLREPHLLRSTIAPILKREDKQPHFWQTYATLFRNAKEGQVVFGERDITWPAPSFGVRVVAAEHLEFFTPNQRERWDDVDTFFARGTDNATRAEILERSHADYILLGPKSPGLGLIGKSTFADGVDGYTLLDAHHVREALLAAPR